MACASACAIFCVVQKKVKGPMFIRAAHKYAAQRRYNKGERRKAKERAQKK